MTQGRDPPEKGHCSEWPPPRAGYETVVALPGSVLSVEPDLRMKTVKAGFIARALAIYRVDLAIIYRDEETRQGDAELLKLLLDYEATPPHLRRRLYPLRPELRYAGLLPPLRTFPHDAPLEPSPGAVVDGVIVGRDSRGCRVYLGRLGYWRLRGCGKPAGTVVTVKIVDVNSKEVVEASWDGIYPGYSSTLMPSLDSVIRWARGRGYVTVAASRLGQCLDRGLACRILREARSRGGVLLAFGGPHGTLYGRAGFDYIVNTVPFQGVKTVRTEEALHSLLALLNAVREVDWCEDSL
ncbi:MAG: hypothetical protein LRS46_00680 [Desulfurococcales archaeon]|nr:hypothetical protein [Desulfurococcales archaeon]